jgi:hypothetical protein
MLIKHAKELYDCMGHVKKLTVELRQLDYEVLLDSDKHRSASHWCKNQFGTRWNPIDNRGGLWSMFWGGRGMTDKYRFCFANEKDMLLFILRWV